MAQGPIQNVRRIIELEDALEVLNYYLPPDMEPEDAEKVRAALASTSPTKGLN